MKLINHTIHFFLTGKRFGHIPKKIDDQQTFENMFNIIYAQQMQATITE